uniref:Putative evasin n=1 Tax=Rhipicephalus microplus TaxID=6941 RepID=A0A6G5A3Q1_RHIMP
MLLMQQMTIGLPNGGENLEGFCPCIEVIIAMSLRVKLICGIFAMLLMQQMTIGLPNGGENLQCKKECHANRSDCPENCACVLLNNSLSGTCVYTDIPDWNYRDDEP